MSTEGRPMLADFGICALNASSTSKLSCASAWSSSRWLASEFFEYSDDDDDSNARVIPTAQTDVWAFGMTVYVCSDIIPCKYCVKHTFRRFCPAMFHTRSTRATLRLCLRSQIIYSPRNRFSREVLQALRYRNTCGLFVVDAGIKTLHFGPR